MKKLSTPSGLSAVSLLFGAVLMALQLWLYATGIDEKNLIVTGHAATLLSWIVTAVAMIVLLAATRLSSKDHRCRPGKAGMLGEAAAAAATVQCGLELLERQDQVFSVAAGVAALIAGLCGALCVFFTWKGTQPRLLLRIPGILFFMLLLICRYQVWSAESQFQTYLFPLLALICLMLASYRKAELEYADGHARSYLLFSRGAILFCLAAIPGSGLGLFFAAMAVWLLTDGCAIHQEETDDEAA